MLKRKIINQLIVWKNTKNKKSLLIQGARQTGKTYSVEEFGRNNYKEMVTINFKEQPEAAEIFSGNLEVDNLVTALRFRYPDKMIKPGETLIFLDEIFP